MIHEPKETNLSDLENNRFYQRYKGWDGDPDDLSSHYKTRFERIKKVDLKYPIIVTTKKGQYDQIIDGHHRILKAIQSNLSVIKISAVNLDIFSDEDARLAIFLITALFKNPRHDIHKK
jgi:hypothetical protein